MKSIFLYLVSLMIVATSFGQRGVTIPVTASPRAMAQQTIGLSTITIDYGRPAVTSPSGENRTGKIWGKLVPYGMSKPISGFGSGNEFPWRAGANENTTITFSHNATINGQKIFAGTYGFHIIVNKDSSATLIFSANYSSWGSYFYEPYEDKLRVDIKTRPTHFTNRLTFDFLNITDESTEVTLSWEHMQFPFTVEYDTKEIVFNNMKDELRGIQGFGWEAPYEAAQYCIDNDIHLDQAEKWIDRSLQSEENFSNLFAKSQLLEKKGKEDEATKIRDKALNLPDATSNNWYTAGRNMLENYAEAKREEQKDKYAQAALKLFYSANKKFGEDMLIQYGLARSYAATGDFKRAIASCKKAIILTENEGTIQFFEGQLKKLEEGKDIN